MRAFEFPSSKNQPQRPASGKPKGQVEARAPGGGFFGGFGTTSKNKKATLSKEAQIQKDQKLKQYREIIGAGSGQQ